MVVKVHGTENTNKPSAETEKEKDLIKLMMQVFSFIVVCLRSQ